MVKSSKKKSGKAAAQGETKATKNTTPEAAKEKALSAELAELRKTAENAKTEFDKAKDEADTMRQKACELESAAKTTYREAVAPYRDACRKAGVECEFTGGRSAPVAPRVRFLLEKTDKGIKVTVQGRPETEKVIPNAELKASVMKAARKYCEEAVGPESEQGKKYAGLYGRLRKLFNEN